MLVDRLGSKRFPHLTRNEMLASLDVMEALLKEWNDLPFNMFVKSLNSGVSYPGRLFSADTFDSDQKLLCGLVEVLDAKIMVDEDFEVRPDFLLKAHPIKAAKKLRPKKIPKELFVAAVDPLDEAYLQAEKEREALRNKEIAKRDFDYMMNFPQMPVVTTSHYTIPHKFSLFLMLYCINVREALVRNVLFAFGEWSIAAELPSYDQILPFFKDRSLFDSVGPIHATCTVIQTVRSILASTFGLRARLLPESFGEKRRPSFAFNFAYQKLYKDCFFRNHSLCILEAMNGSLPVNKELIDIYIAVAAFEKFVDAVEFPTLRISLCPLPVLSNMPQGLLPGMSTLNGTLDFLYLHGLADEKPEINLPKKWAYYVKAKEPAMRLTRELWDASILKLSAWMDGNGTPCFKSIGANKDFEELFSLYFGSFQQSPKYKVDTAMANIFGHINLSSFEKFGSVKTSVNMDEATLIFLLSKNLLLWHKEQKKAPKYDYAFPFAQSIQKRWSLMCSEYCGPGNEKLIRARALLEIAQKYNLK